MSCKQSGMGQSDRVANSAILRDFIFFKFDQLKQRATATNFKIASQLLRNRMDLVGGSSGLCECGNCTSVLAFVSVLFLVHLERCCCLSLLQTLSCPNPSVYRIKSKLVVVYSSQTILEHQIVPCGHRAHQPFS